MSQARALDIASQGLTLPLFGIGGSGSEGVLNFV